MINELDRDEGGPRHLKLAGETDLPKSTFSGLGSGAKPPMLTTFLGLAGLEGWLAALLLGTC